MSKIQIEGFVTSAINEDIKVLLLLAERNFIHISHLVSCNDCVIFINYQKNSYGDKIQEFVRRVIKKSQQSSLCHYGWAVHRPLVYECKVPDYSDFSDQIQIIITVN